MSFTATACFTLWFVLHVLLQDLELPSHAVWLHLMLLIKQQALGTRQFRKTSGTSRVRKSLRIETYLPLGSYSFSIVSQLSLAFVVEAVKTQTHLTKSCQNLSGLELSGGQASQVVSL